MYEIRINSITPAFFLKELGYPQGCDKYFSICTKSIRESRFLELVGDVESYNNYPRCDGKHDDFAQPLSAAVLEFLINQFDGCLRISLSTVELHLNELNILVVKERDKHQIDQSISFIVSDMLDLMAKTCGAVIIVNSNEGNVRYECDLTKLKSYGSKCNN